MPSTPIPLTPRKPLSATFPLPASKSLANRALIIQALTGTEAVTLSNLGDAADVVTMQRLLGDVADGATLDCGPAGTTFRFLTAYLCLRPGTQTLTGSARMLERPIGALVDALRALGADIAYEGEEGYPPLRIGDAPLIAASEVSLLGDISSQYLSALLLIAPQLPGGLRLHWTGELVSRPYLEMTVALMRRFGAEATFGEQSVTFESKPYTAGTYTVESDWSAASYAAAWVAMGEVGTQWTCPGLHDDSLQGDRQLTTWIAQWGVEASFHESGVRFRKTADVQPATFECDFETSPDLAQTFAVLCACTGSIGLFTGLQTLAIKETDRIAAMQTELAKVNVFLSRLPPRFSPSAPDKTFYMQEGRAEWDGEVRISTYHDHRMAMAFSLLAARGAVVIEDEAVVAKSFPGFWHALRESTAG